MRQFTDKDLDEVMADPAVTLLSGWTESNEAAPCDEEAYRRNLSANHDAYMKKIHEALGSASNSRTATE